MTPNRRRNIYPMDPNDPNLRWCKDCEYPYMPDSGCVIHVGRCLTCCGRLQAICGLRALTPTLKRLSKSTQDFGESMEALAEATRAYTAAQVQADIDALYGPQEDRNG